MTGQLLVERAGVHTLIEDLGRPGLARLGVSGSGAWDRAAHGLAQRLVGNDEGAAGLEILLGGVRLRAASTLTIAVTGADGDLLVDGQPAPTFSPVLVRAGAVIEVGRPPVGLRAYLAVRGGLAGRPTLGSLSTDPTANLGPAVLRDGDLLTVGAEPPGPVHAEDTAASARRGAEVVLRAMAGPRDDWFTPEAWALLGSAVWRVSAATDRVGTRLSGPTLQRARTDELPSEPLVRGAIQVPADGQPLVFGPDHPTTGGYPVIACVIGRDADALAQAAPGTVVRFALRRSVR